MSITQTEMPDIDGNTPIYNVSGQRVTMPQRGADGTLTGKKGIYIIGGKKVLVK